MSDCRLLRIWSIIGFIISIYATYVEVQVIFDQNYKAYCDLSPKLSCTAVYNSPYGKGFGLLSKVFPSHETSTVWVPPNAVFGLVFYAILYATTYINHPLVRIFQLILGISSNIMTVYLATASYTMNLICVVCISIYLINFLCLWEMLRNGQTRCNDRKRLKIN